MLVDPKSTVPIYRQIVEQISRAIAAGVYQPGEALPSQRTLAVELRVNPNTVQRAFDELLRDGVIESRRGRGVFVVDRRRTTPRGAVEKSCESDLARAIGAALDAGMTPSRIRELFENGLRTRLSNVRSQP
jgi:GntR family transcriptional regulator